MHKVAKFTAVLIIISLASVFAACDRSASGGTDRGNAAVAATVNGKPISLEEVDRIITQQTGGKQSQMSQLELAAARLQVIDGLIQQQVLFQRAEKDKLLPSEDDITQSISQLKRQANMTEEEWQKTLRDTNQTEQSLREERRKQIAIQKLQEKAISKIGSLSNKEVEDFYNANQQQFVNTRGVGISAVVVDPRDNKLQDDAKGDVEAKAKIDRLYTQLRSGADFATVARASSEDPSNTRSGDMGFATEDDLKQNGFPSDLVNGFFGSMQIGSYTAPAQFGGRWYVFKLTNRQLQNENLTLESPGVREKIKDALTNQRQALLNAALMATAMNEAKIVNNLAQDMLNSPTNLSGVRPAGASPSQQQQTPTPASSPAGK